MIEQAASAGEMDQLVPGVDGKLSITSMLLSVEAPLLVTMMSKPMVLPTATGPSGLAFLRMETPPTVTEVVLEHSGLVEVAVGHPPGPEMT